MRQSLSQRADSWPAIHALELEVSCRCGSCSATIALTQKTCVYTVPVYVGEVEVLWLGGLDYLPAQLLTLLGGHLREDILGQLLIDIGGKVRGYLLIAGCCLLARDRPRPLLVAIDKVLVLLLRTAEQHSCEIHT